MSICPQCGAAVDNDAVVCSNCDALIPSSLPVQAEKQVTLPASNISASNRTAELNARLEKALRRTELLSYAAAGLGLAIFAVIIIIAFL
jgi:predicted nucleic acid-binding Zn ribbon protein